MTIIFILYIILFRGMQTWEYAPQYALRTYAYLLPIAGVAKLYQFILNSLPSFMIQQLSTLLLLTSSSSSSLQDDDDTSTTVLAMAIGQLQDENTLNNNNNKPLLFAMLRSTMAFISCYSELSFLNAIQNNIRPTPTIAHWTAIMSIFAAGSFHANAAFLPSSTVMILWRLSAAHQMNDHHSLAILYGLVAVLAVGWPFCAVLFISTGCFALWKEGCGGGLEGQFKIPSMIRVLFRTLLHTIGIQGIVMAIDYYYYGQVVSPIWNIFAYNAQGGGDELYGVEPLSYYVKNMLLNFNVVAILGVVSLPVMLLKKMLSERAFIPADDSNDIIEVLVLVPMYIWLAIVLPRPHKEERFLFPIYPMICFGAAITMRESLCVFAKLMNSIWPRQKNEKHKEEATTRNNNTLLLGLALLSPFMIISISRSFALYSNYSAPLDAYRDLFYHASLTSLASLGNNNERATTTYVCTAGEWYRFPSSFFLPANHQLGFLKSSFEGQLPQPFTEFGSKMESLNIQAGTFNDLNKEEMDRYVDISQCSYVIELVPSKLDSFDNDDVPECLQYMKSDSSEGSWTKLTSYKYLDIESTPLLHRILYIPFGRDEKLVYKDYNLYVKL